METKRVSTRCFYQIENFGVIFWIHCENIQVVVCVCLHAFVCVCWFYLSLYVLRLFQTAKHKNLLRPINSNFLGKLFCVSDDSINYLILYRFGLWFDFSHSVAHSKFLLLSMYWCCDCTSLASAFVSVESISCSVVPSTAFQKCRRWIVNATFARNK